MPRHPNSTCAPSLCWSSLVEDTSRHAQLHLRMSWGIFSPLHFSHSTFSSSSFASAMSSSGPPLPPCAGWRSRVHHSRRTAAPAGAAARCCTPLRTSIACVAGLPAPALPSFSADLVLLAEPHVHLCSRSACSRSCRVRSGNALRSQSPPHPRSDRVVPLASASPSPPACP